MRIAAIASLLAVCSITLVGCAVSDSEALFGDSNQMFVEETIRELDIAGALRGTIPRDSAVSLVSLETPETTDLPVVAMVEDALIAMLRDGGFTVLERDAEMLHRLASEGPDGKYSFVYLPRDRVTAAGHGVAGASALTGALSTDASSMWGFRSIGVVSGRESGGDRDSVLVFSTDLRAADYIVAYRVLECGLVYRKGSSAQYTKREGMARLHVRVLQAATGEVLYAENLDAVMEDEISSSLKRDLADFHYSFFPATYPITRGSRQSTSEVKSKTAEPAPSKLGVLGGLAVVGGALMLLSGE